MNSHVEALHTSIINLRTDNKVTIKGELVKLQEAGVNVEGFNTKTKLDFIQSLESASSSIYREEVTSELDALKLEIQQTIQQAGLTSFRLGKLLLQAREVSENQQEFLDWADSNFSIKKSWAFKLMKVSQVFEGEPWCKVATSVLYTLQCQASDEQMLEAKKFAEAGKLDVATLKALLAPPVVPVAKAGAGTEVVDKRACDSVQAALMDVTPHDVQGVEASPAPVAQAMTAPEIKPDTLDMQQQLEDALRTIGELSQQLAELQRPRLSSGVQMPMLAQFSSDCLYARLGLSKEDSADKGKILEAFKALCKAGYGRAHEAFPLIDEARHQLIHAGEVA